MAPPPAAAGTAARCGLVGTCAAVAVVLQSLLVAEAGAARRTRDATNNMAPFEQVLPVLSGEQSFADAQLRLRSLRASGYRGRITIELHDTVHRGPPVELGLVDSGFDADGPTVLRGGREGAEGRASFDPGLRVMNWVKNGSVWHAVLPKGANSRQLWINGQRAERPLVHGHGRQGGDNKRGEKYYSVWRRLPDDAGEAAAAAAAAGDDVSMRSAE